MTRVLLTRPKADSEALAALLIPKGYDVRMVPMMDIVSVPTHIEHPDNCDAYILSSFHAYQPEHMDLSKPMICVGERTTMRIREAGHEHVTCGGETMEVLCQTLNSARRYVYLRGRDVKHDVKVLRPDLHVTERVVYQARPIHVLPADVLGTWAPDTVLFFSERTARIFCDNVKSQGKEGGLARTKALCLSEAVLQSLSVLPWQGMAVSDAPTRQSMIDLLDLMYQKG